MGSPLSEIGRDTIEIQHKKRINRIFAIAAKEVTVEQFSRFYKDNFKKDYYVDNNRKYSPTADSPVNTVSWYQAVAYCNWLSEREGIPKDQWCYEKNPNGEYGEDMTMAPDYLKRTGYRLPTEAEWEYACRAGASTSRFYGESDALLEKYAWYSKNSLDRSLLPGIPGRFGVPGDSVKPNDFGLFDMLGNAVEWCQDINFVYRDGDDKEAKSLTVLNKDARILRGGSLNFNAANVRSAHRQFNAPAFTNAIGGFRPARTIAAP
jgi:formylglycine-generating enzyme required for sulfatase activity